MADVYRPSKVSYHGSTAPLDETRCKAKIYDRSGWGRTHQCSRKPWADGWCKTHHPDAEAARRAEAYAKYAKEQRRFAMGWHGERMMAALIKIRDGDNDPRTTAAEALAGIEWADKPPLP